LCTRPTYFVSVIFLRFNLAAPQACVLWQQKSRQIGAQTVYASRGGTASAGMPSSACPHPSFAISKMQGAVIYQQSTQSDVTTAISSKSYWQIHICFSQKVGRIKCVYVSICSHRQTLLKHPPFTHRLFLQAIAIHCFSAGLGSCSSPACTLGR
jgi:hypothetical protein